jgi:hypothetical protein
VKLATSNYDAEYGKVSGGLWQITTKSGTNAFHGSLFENYRTAGFNAPDHFTQPNGIPGDRWNQFGGSLGGPVIKNKVFFFGDYQGMRNNLSGSGNETVPIDAFRTEISVPLRPLTRSTIRRPAIPMEPVELSSTVARVAPN